MLIVCLIKDPVAVDEAVTDLTDRGITQLMLFKCQGWYWIKADRSAIPVDHSCVDDAFECLFMTYFVFNVEYPHGAKMVFSLSECILGLASSMKYSATLDNFMRALGFPV